jgi:HTH-type transcriptional regulator, sugar sensing transcriptional regulator
MKVDTLAELGLSEGQISVYSAILELGISSLNKIQEKTGIERRNIYDILNKLIGRGLVSYTLEKGRRTYQCTHPNKIVEEIKEKQRRLKALEKKIPSIKELYGISRPDIKAEVYRGNEAIKSLLNETLEYKESYWLGGNSFENYTAVTKDLQRWFNHWMERRVEKKHVMFDLVSHGTWLKGFEPTKIKKHKKKYYRYCSLPKGIYSPMVIVIFGDKVAQILWAKQPFAFILDSKKIRISYMKYFNHFWKGKEH